MRFPLLRSRALWFGVPTLLFLLWAWVDSTRNQSWLQKGSPWGSFAFEHWNSAIKIGRAPVGSPSAFADKMGRGPFPTKEPLPPVWWPAVEAKRDFYGRPYIRVPHWLLVLAYIVTWSAVISFRRRHWMKAQRQAGPAQLTTS